MNHYLLVTIVGLLALNLAFSGMVFLIQRAQIARLQADIDERRSVDNLLIDETVRLNGALTDTNARLAFLAEKFSAKLAEAGCYVDQVFHQPSNVPYQYPGYVFVEYNYPTDQYVGLGILCH